MKLNTSRMIQGRKVSQTQRAFQNILFSMNVVLPCAAESKKLALTLAGLSFLNGKPTL